MFKNIFRGRSIVALANGTTGRNGYRVMPYSAEHKKQTRDRIVQCARELFNHRGFSEVSIDDVMRHAGSTRGGFYNHFRNKEDLFIEAIAVYAETNPTDRWEEVSIDFGASPGEVASQVIDAYLSEAHLNDVGGHCPLVALPADVAHAGPLVKSAYMNLVSKMTRVFERGIEQHGGSAAKDRALALTAVCLGAVVLARTVPDRDYGSAMLTAARTAAKGLLDS